VVESRDGCGELAEDTGDARLRAEVRDLRKPCAEDGRPGEFVPLPELNVGGADGDQNLSARAASNWRKLSLKLKIRRSAYLFAILRSCPTMVGVVGTCTLLISALICWRV
jgi:hypothetical protein